MSEMTPKRWEHTCDYLNEVFGRADDHLATLMERAVEAGLPDIAVDASVGRLLKLMVSTTRGRLAVEVGTLGGYSGIWIARGLREGGKLITIEKENRHADFALEQFRVAGLGERVELRRGAALDVLPDLARELGRGSVDVVFLDAIKTEYPRYWEIVRPLIAPGGLIMIDNALGGGEWWIDDMGNESREAANAVNRAIAGDDAFDAACVPIREGVLIARRRG